MSTEDLLHNPKRGVNAGVLRGRLAGSVELSICPQTQPKPCKFFPVNFNNSLPVMEAFQLLQEMTPYIKFGHFTANQAILEAVAGERRVHIVDYDIMEGVQWASLMQSLVTAKNSAPPPHLRITAVRCCGRKPMVQQTGRRLSEFAAAVGLPFSFRQCRLEPDGRFRSKAVKTVRGEAVVFNCALHAPHQAHHAARSVGSFLAGAAEVSHRVIAVVEESGGGRREGSGVVGRFVEEMVRYSAIWDAMEAGFAMEGNKAREMVERAILAPRIAGAVGRAYREDEEGRRWGDWMAEAGYRKLELSSFNYCQAKQLIGLFSEGYGLEQDALNKLTLQWKSRRLVTASIWSAAPAAGDLESQSILPRL
ncbi:Nodulation-signaling pathway 2 protein [Platanthera zijinensis]|uniref:Nodulation-signaling pathway 2 protein n=1 Tax=Platanthera zijinensis TaxID=2320716 RepID=A0AAP0BXL3_9ASPA